MSGFAAIIGLQDKGACQRMLDGIAHCGPDISGMAQIRPAVIGHEL